MQPMPGPPPPRPVWPAAGPAPATDAKAVVALVLGILSLMGTFCWMGLPLGIPAIIFGWLAHRDIRRSEGVSGGRGLATTGIALGSVGSLLFVGWVGFLVFAMTSSKTAGAPPTPVYPTLPPTTATALSTVPPGGWGSIHVVELHASTVPLRTQLEDEVKAAKTAGETVLVQTTARSCGACTEVARAMRDPLLQKVLANVRLVHVDAGDLASELPSVGMNEPALPWFYLLDVRGGTRDGISADEWGDNDPEEIAPVLEAFLRGGLSARHRAWRGATL
jgi:hypothetical protein